MPMKLRLLERDASLVHLAGKIDGRRVDQPFVIRAGRGHRQPAVVGTHEHELAERAVPPEHPATDLRVNCLSGGFTLLNRNILVSVRLERHGALLPRASRRRHGAGFVSLGGVAEPDTLGRDMTTDADFPDDDNGDALRGMAADGVDLISPRLVDFEHCFPDEPSARAFQAKVAATVLEAKLLAPDPELGSGWEVQCIVRMIPTHAAITATELRLGAVAKEAGGHADGWGSMSNPDGSPVG